MKIRLSILLSSSLVFIGQDVCGQTNEFAPVGAKWWYSYYDLDSYYYIESIKDTVYMGKNCREIISKIVYNTYEDSIARTFIYINGDTVFYAVDTFYGWPELPPADTNFHILYNFGASVDDTWDIYPGDYIQYPFVCEDDSGDYVQVDSVYIENIAGFDLKKIVFHEVNSFQADIWTFHGSVYEIFGKLNGYMFPLSSGCATELKFPSGLRCYEDDSIGLISFVSYDCDYRLALEESSNQFHIFPNPAESFINIHSSHIWNKVSVINQTGQIMNIQSLLVKEAILDVSFLPIGMYFLKIEVENKIFYSAFIKI
ncbi:MAG: T9SS type A sorting domain-containing protein [Chitinophagales bacterium]